MTGGAGGSSTEAADRVIVDDYVTVVRHLVPGLVTDNGASLGRQAERILADTRARLGRTTAARVTPPPDDPVGKARALTGVHPSRSLEAAGILFRVALPRLIAEYEEGADSTRATAERVSLALHTAISDRLVAASVSYFGVVLDRLNTGHMDERRRISRDLHDRTSHGIGAALQGVDLALLQIEHGGTPDVERLTITRRTLLDTLNDVRAMSSLLRDVLGDRTLFEALREYVDAHTPPGLRVRMREEAGATHHLRGLVAEESYMVLREAVRNCILHSAATELDLVIRLDAGWLVGTVTDDGHGFDEADLRGRHTVGLASMKERAHALGGSVGITVPDGGGVHVLLRIPVSADASPAGP